MSTENMDSKELQQEENISKSLKRVTVVGWFQIVSAIALLITLAIVVSKGLSSFLVGAMFIALITLNAVAGYTALKNLYRWYWLSIVNQSLQVVSFALGNLIYSYNAIGGIFFTITTYNGLNIGLQASIEPGFKIYYIYEAFQNPAMQVDILAIMLITALVTSYKHHKK